MRMYRWRPIESEKTQAKTKNENSASNSSSSSSRSDVKNISSTRFGRKRQQRHARPSPSTARARLNRRDWNIHRGRRAHTPYSSALPVGERARVLLCARLMYNEMNTHTRGGMVPAFDIRKKPRGPSTQSAYLSRIDDTKTSHGGEMEKHEKCIALEKLHFFAVIVAN